MMDDRRERAWALFDQLADVPAEQREAVLRAACGDDVGLRAKVERLLALDDRLAPAEGQAGFLCSPLFRTTSPASPRPEPALPPQGKLRLPDHVGRYRVLGLLGEGGMGAVYEAEQDSPHRPVALKVIRPGLLAPAFLKRFGQEVEILGRFHHPGIAQIYEAGVAQDGQPFFAMELIRGLPLDEYARLRSLTLPARVELLARVCDAVQHAHDQGVIHRDLKPANILVEESGQPKVLDFGVARATGADVLTTAGLTQTGQLLGTPNYMSPEQVTANPTAIDHRTDVYALGVILFELAAHRLPYQLENRPLAEAALLILEQEPPRLGSINPELRGDVETIVAKALEKDPARRYPSAAELAADLRRWLAHEPILARPPSALYHLRKFARRHKGLVGGVAATGVALVLGLVGTILFAVGEARQRSQAEHNAQQATEQRNQAEHNARVALDEKREAQFQTYRARMAAASAALSAHDVADAARQLDAAPEDLRGWEWRHFQSRLEDSSAVVPVPAGGVSFLLGAPDRLQARAMTPAGLRLTDLEGGEPKTLPIGPDRGHSVTATQTRRGLRVVAWVGNTTFDLLDEAGRVLCRVEIPEGIITGPVAVSPDGTRLASIRIDGEWQRLAVFDATSGKQTAVCDGHRDSLWDFAFSPDGKRLASGGEDRMARLWDPATGALLATCRGHTSKVLGVAFRPDGARLVTTSADGTVRQWDAATGREVEPPYDRHSGEVAAAMYSPDGLSVASAGTDRTIRVWRAKGREDIAVLHGHTGDVIGVAFAPDGRLLASRARDGTVRVWDVDPRATLPVLRRHTNYVYPVAFSPDGRWIASGGWDIPGPGERAHPSLRLSDAATGEQCATLPHPGIVRTLAYGPDGRWLVTGGDGDDRLRIWDTATARVRKEIRGPGPSIRLVTVSPDGARVAASSFDAQAKFQISVYDATSGQRLFSAAGSVLAYSPDGRWLAALEADGKKLVLRDARTHRVVVRFSGHEDYANAAAFSPDSRRLASCSWDRTVRVWSIDPLTLPSPPGDGGEGRVTGCQVLRGHTDEVFAVAFHPDGSRLATAGKDRAVWLWDLARSEEVARLPGHTSYVWSLAFSPDGATLASGSGDFTVRLWDTAPLKTRYQARRAAAALRSEAEQLVEQLWRAKNDPAEVVAALRADRALSEPLRQAALRAVLRCVLQAEAAPGNPHDPP
jgi:WD40 repeat protein